MNVSRRQFGTSLGALFGGLFLFRGASAATGSPAAEIPEDLLKNLAQSHEKLDPLINGYFLRGTIADDPRFSTYIKSDGHIGYQVYFSFQSGTSAFSNPAGEAFDSIVAWDQQALELRGLPISKGTRLFIKGTPVGTWIRADRIQLDT